MSIEPTPAIGEARAALAARLREIRVDADVSAIDLARRAGWPRSKVSKIEHARQTPTADDIRVWCRHIGADDQAADLIATRHAVEGMWVELRRLQRTGLRRFQDSFVPLWERMRPNVSLGIIPRHIDRTMWASPGFWIYDDERVIVETPSAQLTITQPREVTIYARWFAELSLMAVVGYPARRIITDAIAALDT
ncbi:Scr1 family TA system antitoxin-like transcriptional regulator [Dactylosporangium sucinum]|uniref:HTH cro/C1-type domain-containing protein n=1 Tax=Dactylosporangium sucinum TaxID=1424081 RepID=A0A917UBL9_9ACTN|nr:helix-turn-helix domain-containing protein [Dactylosporangium sucinum]GGM78311.1 hypothetical protein GCM10007977_094770 [Dactylosporangium sucinum]